MVRFHSRKFVTAQREDEEVAQRMNNSQQMKSRTQSHAAVPETSLWQMFCVGSVEQNAAVTGGCSDSAPMYQCDY